MHLFIGLLRTWRTTLSENQRRLSGSHALLERLCSQFQRCTLVTLLFSARTANSDPEPGGRISARELSSSDCLLSQGLAACWRSGLLVNN